MEDDIFKRILQQNPYTDQSRAEGNNTEPVGIYKRFNHSIPTGFRNEQVISPLFGQYSKWRYLKENLEFTTYS